MPSARRFAAPILVVFLFIVSRLLFQPVSLGVSTFSFGGDLAARIAGAVDGRNFDLTTLDNGMPILDRALLLGDLGRSLWYLHSQPPLFNLFVALVLRLPGDFARNYQWINWAFALALYLGAYVLMRRLRVNRWLAAAAVVAFMLTPNAMWMESAVYYGLPLALLLVFAALSWERAIHTGSVRSLAVASLLIVLLPLTRAFFTSIWCATVLLFFAFVFTERHGKRRRAAEAALLPFLLVVAFQVKQGLVFRQFLGSSWFGCNLATMTAGMSGEKIRELAAGRVSPLVKVYRNAAPAEFLAYFHVEPTGIPALDQLTKSTGQPNFNHAVYLSVGRVYLRDTLHLIARYPHKYLLNVVNSVYVFSGYQIGVYFDYPSRFFARWTWRDIAAPFVGFPLLILALWTGWRRLRTERDSRPLTSFLWFNILYVMAVSCLFEKSEGSVYRYQVDAFLWVFLALAANAWIPALATRFPSLKVRPIASPATDVRN